MFLGSGKQADQQEVHALPAGDSNLVFLQDSLSVWRFLVDTGASVSIFPLTAPTLSALLSQTKLLTTSNSPQPCFCACSIPLCFGSCHFSWSFQLAPASVPILGSNFLCLHALLVDMARARVLDVLSTVSSPATSDVFCAHLQQAPREIWKLLTEYPDVLFFEGFSASTPKHVGFHELPTIPVPPVFAKAHCLDPGKLASAQGSFSRWRRPGLFEVLPLHGPALSTWFLNLMVPEGPVEMSAASHRHCSLQIPSIPHS